MLLCPRCTKELRTERAPQGNVFACGECGGLAATMPFLRKRVAVETINAVWASARATPHREGCACPACHDSMAEVALKGGDRTVVVDACERCQMLWFDRDEMAFLPERASPLPPEMSTPGGSNRVIKTGVDLGSDFAVLDPLDRDGLAGLAGLPTTLGAPESDARPWATWALAMAMAALFAVPAVQGLASNSFPGARDAVQGLANVWGFVPSDPARRGGATWLTSIFLHGSVGHLLGNLYFLLLAGATLEPIVGIPRYLGLFLASALAGNAADLLVRQGSDIPGIGASGAISGLFAFYALALPRVRIGLAFWGALGGAGQPALFQLRLGVRWVFGLWLAWQVLATGMVPSNVAYQAHVGGALAGLAWWAAERSLRARVPATP